LHKPLYTGTAIEETPGMPLYAPQLDPMENWLKELSLTSSDRSTHKCVLEGNVKVTKLHNFVDEAFKPR
jgi:hypothetical protein